MSILVFAFTLVTVGCGHVQLAPEAVAVGPRRTTLTANNPGALGFGRSVSVDGDIAVIGAPFSSERGRFSGAVFVFGRDPTTRGWRQTAKLVAANTRDGDQFGWSVSIAGDTIIVGAVGASDRGEFTGSAYIFQRQPQSDAWREVKTLGASSRSVHDHFGESVSIDGDTAIVGAPQGDGSPADGGAVHVFERHRTGVDAWGEVARLTAMDRSPGDAFGFSVGVSGDTVLIGAPGDSDARLAQGGIGAGSVYFFTRQAHGWQQAVKRVSSEAALQDAFGWSVAIQGNTAVVGAPGADGPGVDEGAAYVFEGGKGQWNEVGQLWPGSAVASGCCRGFGWSVSVDENTAVVGSPENDQSGGASPSGAIYAFHRGTSPRAAWRDALSLTVPRSDRDDFGRSVAVSGATAIGGAPQGGDGRAGAAYLFGWTH